MIYFDHNATTPLLKSVLDAMRPYELMPGNAASVHQAGRLMRHAIGEAREKIAALIGAQANEIFFTSGGTEANNWALQGLAATYAAPGVLYVSPTEHDSILASVEFLKKQGWQHQDLSVDHAGLIKTDSWSYQGPGLCSVMLVNNESGVVQPWVPVQDFCQKHNVWLHTDAAQALGKISVDFQALGVALMTLSAHKVGGPKGVGALIKQSRVPLEPLIRGGGHQQGLRSGTENVAGIVGFGEAAENLQRSLKERIQHFKRLTEYLETRLSAFPDMLVLAAGIERAPNTVLFCMDRIEGEMLLMQLDKRGVCVSSGSACHQETQTASHVIKAMNVPPHWAQSVIRVSFGPENTISEIDYFLAALQSIRSTLCLH